MEGCENYHPFVCTYTYMNKGVGVGVEEVRWVCMVVVLEKQGKNSWR